jgi:hypothetical protein
MKASEIWDEGVAGRHVADNGFVEPRIAFFCETVTRLGAVRANGRAKEAPGPISDALPAPLTQQAHTFQVFFSLLLPPDTGEPGMGHH